MSIVETPVSKENAHIYMRKRREHVGDALQRVDFMVVVGVGGAGGGA